MSAPLRTLIEGGGTWLAPGCYDGLSARLIGQAGFRLVYASGGAIARSTGVPDLGLMDMGEVAARLTEICAATEVPVIADADTGYGNALNARRAAQAFLRAGVAAIHLEDQTFPKRCGHYDGKSVVGTEAFCQKLRAVRDAVGDDLVVIARTDALAVEGFDAAIDRCHAYAGAGADVIFFEAPESAEQIERIGMLLPYPKLLNMFAGGKTPVVPLADLSKWGYRIVIVPSDLQRAAIHAMQSALAALARDGDTRAMPMVSFAEREAIIGTSDWNTLERRFAE